MPRALRRNARENDAAHPDNLRAIDDNLGVKPDSALVDYLRIPEKFVSPGRRIARRLLYALLVLVMFAAFEVGGDSDD